MLNMKESALLVLVISFAAALTASLILASWTYEVQLVTTPYGQNIYAPAGEPFNISCQGVGGDESKFVSMEWLNPEGNIIAEGIPGVVRSGKSLLHLTFTDPRTEDSGTHTCSAVYEKDYRLKYRANIKFYGPAPEFESAFENVTAEEGSTVEMHCSALGDKPMRYRWYDKNDALIPDQGTDITVSNSEDESRLTIAEVKKSQQGMFTCSADNEHGLSSKLYNLHVSSKSGDGDNSFQDIKVANVSSSSVQFRIVVDESVKTIEVKYIESRDATEYRTRFSAVSGNLYSIEHLIPSGLYSFQFSAADTDSWTDVYNVTLLPDVPELIFNKLEVGTFKLQWFRKIDDIMRGTIDKFQIKYFLVQQQGGNIWIPNSCAISIEVPSCFGSGYTISGLGRNVFYQLEVRAHTASGYGEPVRQKFFLPDR